MENREEGSSSQSENPLNADNIYGEILNNINTLRKSVNDLSSQINNANKNTDNYPPWIIRNPKKKGNDMRKEVIDFIEKNKYREEDQTIDLYRRLCREANKIAMLNTIGTFNRSSRLPSWRQLPKDIKKRLKLEFALVANKVGLDKLDICEDWWVCEYFLSKACSKLFDEIGTKRKYNRAKTRIVVMTSQFTGTKRSFTEDSEESVEQDSAVPVDGNEDNATEGSETIKKQKRK
ncbi:hypothetical protein BDB01DRAFT_773572 [Pilobolus umbonatus]|nr:hypothetical protein BDB01DRAFT_773572 [Pilobolus umbonatus]